MHAGIDLHGCFMIHRSDVFKLLCSINLFLHDLAHILIKISLFCFHLLHLMIISELKDRVENVVAVPQDVERTEENVDLVEYEGHL